MQENVVVSLEETENGFVLHIFFTFVWSLLYRDASCRESYRYVILGCA